MRVVKIKFVHYGPLLKNLLTVLMLLSGIVLAVLALYLVETVFYRHQHATATLSKPGAPLHKITVAANDVYDLSGSEASGGGDPFKLFDEQADPGNGLPGDPKTNPSPPAKIDLFYPANRGYRIVIDLHDLYALSDIYLYDRSFESDSIWLYTGSFNNWKLAAAYATTSHTATWGWQHFAVGQSSRFVMVRFNSYKSIASELALYGNLQQKLPADTLQRLPALPPVTLRQFAGTNSYDYVSPHLLQPFSQTRLYQQMDYFDRDTVHAYPKNKLSLNAFQVPQQQQLRYFADSLHQLGNHLWMSIRGMPVYLEQKGFNEKDKPVTAPGMDTEDPLSYGRHAKTFWTLAALFGKTKIDTALIDVTGVPRFSGLGLMDRFENGNEEDAYWTKYYWTPMDYFAISSADYDGHEGRLGPMRGLHAADGNSRLMTSGMIQLDTNRIKTLAFLCRQLRKDKKFIWQGGVQYHYYSNEQKSNLQSPSRGISPEDDHLRERLAKVRAFHNRLLPGVPLILGENGYDRNQHSWQRTPLLPGYNEAQSQGIMVIRSLIAAFMAGFDGYNQYMMRNATNDENVPGPYATSGMIGGPATSTIYPMWYYWSAVVQRLGNFVPDAIISERGPVWIYRLKDQRDARKKAFVLFSPTTNGSAVKNFSLNDPSLKNQPFTIVRLSDNNAAGVAEPGRFSNGAAVMAVGESPVMVVE